MAARNQPVATPVPLPAPYMGINTREGVAALELAEARYLENWQPAGNTLTLRPGNNIFSSGASSESPVETLASFEGTAARQIIGVAGGSIWDFSSATAILLSASGFTDSRFQWECYNNRVIAVNGSETPWSYNGTSVAATGFTGSSLTISNLINVAKVRNRLWFCEKDSADVWYGGLGSITGSLTKFQLSQVVAGGYCMAIGAHSQDAGAGPDDYTAFIMSTGEVVLYSGDPSSTFTKVGNYRMPQPVGRQCLANIGGPLAVLTHIGLVPLQAAVQGIAFDAIAIGPYGKIGPSIKDDLDRYATNVGWQVVVHEGKVIVNVPVEEGETSRQWVYNFLSPAWTSWSGIDAACFCVHHDLFYGDWMDGQICKMEGTTDRGQAITVRSRQAFAADPRGRGLSVNALRFDIALEGTLTGKFGIDTDYLESSIEDHADQTIAGSTASTPWGSSWGSDWSSSTQYTSQWLGTHGMGRSVALVMDASAIVTDIKWAGSALLAQPTGVL